MSATIFWDGQFKELNRGEKCFLNRDVVDGDRSVTNSRAPEIYFGNGQWHLQNNYEQGDKLVVFTADEGYIFRAPGQFSLQLMAGTSSVIIGNPGIQLYEVGVTVYDVEALSAPAIGDTLGSRDYAQADLEIQKLLDSPPPLDWRRIVILTRFQEFLDPTNADPRPLTAAEVDLCSSVKSVRTNELQKQMKEITGLDATAELGDWLTHRGLIRTHDAAKVSHLACEHRYQRPRSARKGRARY